MNRATKVGTSGRPELEPLEPRLLLSGTWVAESVTWNYATGAEGFLDAPCSLALDNADDPHVAYLDGQFDYQGNLYYNVRHATFNGWTWNRFGVAQAPDGDCQSLVLDSQGRPHIVYQTTDTLDLKYAAWNGSAWITHTVDSSGLPTQGCSLLLDGNDAPHLAYSVSTGGVVYAVWNGSSWVKRTVDTHISGKPSLALDRFGTPRISYYDDLNDDLVYAAWSGVTWNKWVVHDSADGAYGGYYNCLAVDEDGNPGIGYNSDNGLSMEYVFWDGSSWVTQTVDAPGLVQLDNVLEIDGDGNPHLLYHAGQSTGLYMVRYAVWDDTSWVVDTVSKNATWWPADLSLSLDSGGNPHAVYFAQEDFDTHLKYASLVPDPVGTSAIYVRGNDTPIEDDATWAGTLDGTDFGSVVQGTTPPTRTFSVHNAGTGTLALGAPTLPPGFSLVEPLATFIAPHSTDTFTVQLDTNTAGTFEGDIRFATNDIDRNPFNFKVLGAVDPAPNDAPSFTKGPDQTLDEDSPAQALGNWATAISAGPSYEAGQKLTFLMANDNNALFRRQPAIAPNGTLTFTTAPDANGTATVTVRLKDNGGTYNGGVDTSAPQTFTINVIPVNDAPTLTTIDPLAEALAGQTFPITYDALAAAANEADVDSTDIVFRVESVAAGALLIDDKPVVPGATLFATGDTLLWLTPTDVSGVLDAFTVTAWDGALASDSPVPVRVAVADRYEPNDGSATAPDVTPDLLAGSGLWDAPGLSIHRIDDHDWFRLDAPVNTDGDLVATVSNLTGGLTGSVYVYQDLGAKLKYLRRGNFGAKGLGCEARVAGAQPGATYYVKVAGTKNKTGAYDLGVSLDLAQEAKDTFEGGRLGNGTVRGAGLIDLDINGQALQPNLTIHKAADVDWYKFAVPYGTTGTGTIQMASVANGLQGRLALYDSTRSKQPFQEADGAAPNAPVTLNATGLAAGKTYYVQVCGLNNTAGLYDLSVAIDMLDPDAREVNDGPDTATDITPDLLAGKGLWGEAGLSIHRSHDQDWFRLDAPVNTDGNLLVTVGGMTGGLQGTVSVCQEIRGKMKPLRRGIFGRKGLGCEVCLTNAVPGATYYVKVDNMRYETGAYDLGVSLDLAQEPKDTFEGGRLGNGTVRGAGLIDLEGLQGPVGGLTIHKAADVDWYKFTVPYGTTGTGTIQMDNVANGLQGYLGLYDSTRSKQPLQEASGAAPNAPVTLNAVGLAAGKTYYVQVCGLNNTAGVYDLSLAIDMLDPDAREVNNDDASATDITPDLLAGGGVWNQAGLSIHRSHDQDWFRVDAPVNTDGDLVVTVDGMTGGLQGTVSVCQEIRGKMKPLRRGIFGRKGLGCDVCLKNAVPGATYYVKVDNTRNETGAYDLGVSLDLAQEQKDAFEGGRLGNETVRGAGPIALDINGQALQPNLTVHKAADVDWYKFAVPYGTTGTGTIQMASVANGLQGRLALYDSTRSRQPFQEADGAAPNDPVTLNAAGLAAGKTYYLQVRGLNNTAGLYDLSLAIDMLDPDAREVNDDQASATDITPDLLAGGGVWNQAGLSIHRSDDQDWFRVDAPPNTDGDLVVTVDGMTGGLQGLASVCQEVKGRMKVLRRGLFGRKGLGCDVCLKNAQPGATYYIKVDNLRNDTGAYDVGVQLDLAGG